MNLLKISTCVLCLGMALGLSSMAMEQNDGECHQAVSERLQESVGSEGRSKRYLRFYNDLMTKGDLKEADARRQAEIFEGELKKGKSFIYAQYYSMLRVVRRLEAERAMFQSEVFEKEFDSKGKDFRNSDYYATIVTSYNLKEMRLKRLEKEINLEKICKRDMKFYRKIMRLTCEAVESGKSYNYIKRYIELMADEEFENKARLQQESLSRKMMLTELCPHLDQNKNSMIEEIKDELARDHAGIIDSKTKEDKSYHYAKRYIELIFSGKTEAEAISQAEMVDEEMAAGRSYIYAVKYAEMMADGFKDWARKAAEIVDEKVKEGKSYGYATIYSDLIVRGKSKQLARKQGEIVENEMKEGTTYCYARRYAELITDGMSEEGARREAEAYDMSKR